MGVPIQVASFGKPMPRLMEEVLDGTQATALRRGNVFQEKIAAARFENPMDLRYDAFGVIDRAQNQRADNGLHTFPSPDPFPPL